MLLNKKCIYVLFLFYGALLFAQDTKPMTPATISNTAQKILAHITQPPANVLPKISNSYNFHKPNSPGIILSQLPAQQSVFVDFLKNVAHVAAIHTSPLNDCLPRKYYPKILDNNPLKLLTNIQTQNENESMVKPIDPEALVAFLLIIHHTLKNDSQQMLLDHKSANIMPESYAKDVPLAIMPSDTVPPQIQLNFNMNLHASRIKPLYYFPDTVARIMEKNSFLNNKYKVLKKKVKTLETTVSTTKNNIAQLEQEINAQKQHYSKLQANLNQNLKRIEELTTDNQTQQTKIMDLQNNVAQINKDLALTQNKLQEKEHELATAMQKIKDKEEKNSNLEQEKKQLTTEFNNLKKEYDDQVILLDRHREKHEKLNASFNTIQTLLKDDKKEEIEQLKNEIITFKQSLQKIQDEDKETLKKISEEKTSLEKQCKSQIEELTKQHEEKCLNQQKLFNTQLTEKNADLANLQTTNTQLQNTNNWLTTGLLIACILFCLENIYYKNKIEKLTQLLHK